MAWYDGILSPLGGGAPGGGGGGILSPLFADRQDSITAMGLGLLSGRNNAEGFEGAMQGFAQGRRSDLIRRGMEEEKAQKDREAMQVAQMAQKLGLPEATDPQVVRSLFVDRFKRREPSEFDRLTEGLSPEEKYQARLARLGLSKEPKVTEFDPNKDYAVRDPAAPGGYRVIRSAQPGATRDKPPPGYRWTADGNLEAIEGGPATKEQGETAGRLAVADEFLKNAPAIEESIKAGTLTGPLDAGAAQFGYGKQGEIYRQMQSGVDALRRSMSGAGIPPAEADEYAGRYMPQYTDTAAKLLSKHRQLVAELRRFSSMAHQGRGPSSAQVPAPSEAPAQTGSAADTGSPARVQTREDYSALPSGAKYVAPDGKVRIKR